MPEKSVSQPVATPQRPLLEAVDLHVRYGLTTALAGVSLRVGKGEVVALLGPSGSGKSTLLHCLAGLVPADEGSVWFAGDRVDDQPDAWRSRLRRERFGFVFQFGSLVPELTALENVSLPLRLLGQRRRGAERRAGEWLERLGVSAVAGKRPGEMSGGQGQRVAVARALITGPDVVFADEPTGALDSANGEMVVAQLLRSARSEGAAVVIVTHDTRVAEHADRQVSLRDGLVLEPVTVPL